MAATASRNLDAHNVETKALSSWFARFKSKPQKKETGVAQSIFSVPLQESITYANVAISLYNDEGTPFIYGYIPIVVAKCGLFLKENATETEGIFRLSGSAKRIKDLQTIFDEPPKYGKLLNWDGFTVHDAANILRRYLNHLPDPIIPFDWYDAFREPVKQTWALEQAIPRMQELVASLPPLNRQLLLYILDLLAVFASKSDINRMTSENLSAIFQPGLLTHPRDDMAPQEYRLSQEVLVFLIDNQSNFLLDMCPPTQDQVPSPPVAQKKGLLRRRTLQTPKHSPDSAKQSHANLNEANNSPLRSTTPVSTVNLSRSNTLPTKRMIPPENDTIQSTGPRHASSPMVVRAIAAASESRTVASIPEGGVNTTRKRDSLLAPPRSQANPTSETSRASTPRPLTPTQTSGSISTTQNLNDPHPKAIASNAIDLPRPVSHAPIAEAGHIVDRPIRATEIKPSSSPSKFGNFFKKKPRAHRESHSSSTGEAFVRRDLDT